MRVKPNSSNLIQLQRGALSRPTSLSLIKKVKRGRFTNLLVPFNGKFVQTPSASPRTKPSKENSKPLECIYEKLCRGIFAISWLLSDWIECKTMALTIPIYSDFSALRCKEVRKSGRYNNSLVESDFKVTAPVGQRNTKVFLPVRN